MEMTRRQLVSLFVLGFLALILPLSAFLIQYQTRLSSKAFLPPVPINLSRVFVTSLSYSGNLGGLSGADAKCQERASAANLGGTWKAWLSDSQTSASSRLFHSSGPYVRMDGVTIANNWADLTDGILQKPINITETGSQLPAGWAWTFTNPDGSIPTTPDITPAKFTCDNWTSSTTSTTGIIGAREQSNYRWSWDGGVNCYSQAVLYCFEQFMPLPTSKPVPTATSTPGSGPTPRIDSHTECRQKTGLGIQCVSVPGPGVNQCRTSSDCLRPLIPSE